MELDAQFVSGQAPNANAVSNGRALVVKGKFVALNKSPDGTVLFGQCAGSGKSPYQCSCDFVRPGQPTYRCTCPSRQFPCKHCIGLMFAHVDGKPFTTAEVPDDLAEKRGKLIERVEKKKADASQPKKVNTAALTKKIAAQLKGIDLLESLLHDLVGRGMGATNSKVARQIQTQAKQLGDAYLPGAQAALLAYTNLFIGGLRGDAGRFDDDIPPRHREAIYTDALDQLTRLSAIVRHGRRVLQRRLDDLASSKTDSPRETASPPETDSPIEAWLGHAWQLSELRAAGLTQTNAELIQLAFHSHDDAARQEFVETGIWMNLGDGAISLTQNYRPYKAAKHIREQDSFFKVVKVPELCVYPGTLNRRIRWDEFDQREPTPADFKTVRRHAFATIANATQTIRSELKNPLAEKRPVIAVAYQLMGHVTHADTINLVIQDAAGDRIVLTESGLSEEPPSCHLMSMLPDELQADQVVIGRVHQNLDTKTLQLKPLSIVTTHQIFRLTL